MSPALRPARVADDELVTESPQRALTECPSTSIDRMSSPCLEVIRRAERRAEELGHENDGFLSSAHGFLPAVAPLEALSRPFAAWDQVAAELPLLYRDLTLRRRVDDLPLLDASERSLDDRELLRACALLAIIAQAYWNVELRPPEQLPLAVSRPWAELRRRLGREQEVLSYIDLIVYNWRVVDASLPLEVENLRLLLPTVDNREERVFYLTQLEILGRCSPIVGLIAEAQNAVLAKDDAALERVLVGITAALTDVVRTSLPKINPNRFGSNFVDPVVWAKTVAPFAVPMRTGDQGPSGTSSPIFNTLDLFFGRKRFSSFLGREIQQLRAAYPPHWRAFLQAITRVPVSEYIERQGTAALRSAWHDALQRYVGSEGFLGRHRMKVYGYLEIAFKVGRSITIGGFGGVFKDRTWDQVDNELEASRGERMRGLAVACPMARVQRQAPESNAAPGGVHPLTLDVSRAGVRPTAGDRCAIYPENAPLLVDRTLLALGSKGDELVGLTDEWRATADVRRELAGRSTLPLRRVLELGCIRPVTPRVAEALHARTQNTTLLDQIRRGATERWELWELIELLRREGSDPTSLWREPGVLTSQRLCQIIPPDRARVYSVASVGTGAAEPARVGQAVLESSAALEANAPTGPQAPASSLDLLVGHLAYPAPPEVAPATCPRAHGPVSKLHAAERDSDRAPREGTASSFLARAARAQSVVTFRLEHPARFQPPRDPRTPIIFFAGGTGVAPFASFLQQRLADPGSAPCWLLWSLRTRKDLIGSASLASALASGRLMLDLCFTREAADARVDDAGALHVGDGASRRIGDLIVDPSAVARLAALLEPDEGPGAMLYVCGRGGFAKSVLDALVDALGTLAAGSLASSPLASGPLASRRFTGGVDDERAGRGQALLRRLVADHRLLFEIHTDTRPQTDDPRLIDVSEVAEHNDERAGYWVIIDRAVYDLTRFVDLHPGGQRIVQAYAGMDATHGYARAHDQRPEVDAMREMYRIGMLRQLDFDDATAEVMGPSGPVVISCRTAHQTWVRALELVVEMQNALVMDYSLQQSATTAAETAAQTSAYRLSRGVETHARFIESYRRVLELETLPGLWRITQGLFAPEMSPDWLMDELGKLQSSEAAREIERATGALLHHGTAARTDQARWQAMVQLFQAGDVALLAELKRVLSCGVRVFERHERRTRTCGAGELRQVCAGIIRVFERAFAHLSAELGPQLAALPVHASKARARPAGSVPRRLYTSRHWLFDELPERRLSILQRTPAAWESLAALRAENETILGLLRDDQRAGGLLVDMRQAPIRNDPAFEDAMAELRLGLTSHFERTSILLESALGELQVTRLERDEHRTATVTTRSESTALNFLSGNK
jgi:cytochrome b involved in lipid metabolism